MTTTAPKSLLSPKDRNLGPHAQVQKLVRIGRRALAHADWIATLYGFTGADTSSDSYRSLADSDDREAALLDMQASRDKARHAADEMLSIALSSDDMSLRRKARTALAAY